MLPVARRGAVARPCEAGLAGYYSGFFGRRNRTAASRAIGAALLCGCLRYNDAGIMFCAKEPPMDPLTRLLADLVGLVGAIFVAYAFYHA